MTRTKSEIESENANLRALLVQAKNALTALTAKHDELRRLAADTLKTIREGGEIRFGVCPWCSEAWLRPDDDQPRIEALAAEHDNACARNPLRIERDAMRVALIHLGTLQLRRSRDAAEAWAIRETANDLSAPFSDERVMARLAEMLAEEPAP